MAIWIWILISALDAATAQTGFPQGAYSGYLRAGAGINTKGGDQSCFNNSGAPTNEFRYGNECTLYTELSVRHNLYKLEGVEFGGQWRAALVGPAESSFEGEREQLHLVEAFADAKGVHGNDVTYWVGKRFYREQDLQFYDWYYFGNMSGVGAGVQGLPLAAGQVDVAVLRQISPTQTTSGKLGLTAVDFRWRGRWNEQELLLWAAYGVSTGGVSVATHYERAQGWLAGVKWQKSVDGGFDALSLIHGRDVMQSLSLYGEIANVAGTSTQNAQWRWRHVYHRAREWSPTWAYQAAYALETWSSGAATDDQGRWWSVGFSPIWFLSDHFQVASVLGTSGIEIESERLGWRRLTRLTIGPQWAPKRSQWSRPQLRLFYSHSWWNESNQSKIADSAPEFRYARGGGNIGAQVELWF